MEKQEYLERYSQLKKMHFSGMAEELKNQFEDAEIENLSCDERIFRLIDAESETRDSKKYARLMKAASLRYPDASINQTLLNSQGVDEHLLNRLSSCEWIDDKKDLLITGKTGTGKSYCACALGSAAAAQFRSVKYHKASQLLRDLQNAENSQTLTEELNRLSKYDLLIVDDFGLMNLDMDMCRNLFELIDVRDGRKSNIFISQFPVSEWYDLFKDSTYADACLDRLTGQSYRLEFSGDSLRRG